MITITKNETTFTIQKSGLDAIECIDYRIKYMLLICILDTTGISTGLTLSNIDSIIGLDITKVI